jgi:hypothetical protein
MPIGANSLHPNTGNLSEFGFLANGTTFTLQITKISSFYICERTGKLILQESVIEWEDQLA